MNTVIDNGRIRAELDRETGSLLSLSDPRGGSVRTVSSCGFSLAADGKTYFRDARAVSSEQTPDGAEWIFCDGGFTARLRCTLLGDGPFIERELSFRADDGRRWEVQKIVCDDVRFSPAPQEILFHDDQTLWHVPTNYFVRYGDGGLCCGLEYPYWDLPGEDGSPEAAYTEPDRVVLGFSPCVYAEGGEWFTAERTFWGVYRNEGILRRAAGPYPGRIPLPYYNIFAGVGLNQHIKGMKIPQDMGFPCETLDWGEVWTMQEFFTLHLPIQPLPEDGWWIWQNGWWARLFSADTENLVPLARAGVKDVLTAAIYYGHDKHPSTEPAYIRAMRIDPPGFPIFGSASDGVKQGTDGLHSNAERGEDGDIVGYSDRFEAPPDYELFIRRAREMGIWVSSFSTPNNVYRDRPEWAAKHKDGTAHEYFGTRVGCPACREYMDFQFEMLCRVFEHCQPRLWTFDGRWLNYREIAGYHFGWIGVEPCYSPDHGHPVGESRYAEWKNIELFKEKLRRRWPSVCFEQYYGLKRGGVWSLGNINSDENYYEMGSIENNRYQTWHNENGRFRPVYLNYASIFGAEPASFEYSIVSCLSTSYYCQLSLGFHALKNYPETADTLKKWKRWADANIRFLKSRRTLFGMPGEYAADGSAHVVGDEGLLFLFTAPGRPVDARIPLCRWIGLAEKPDQRYRIRIEAALHTKGETADCAIAASVLRYGDILRCRLSPDSAFILRLEPCADGEMIPEQPEIPFSSDDEIAEAFPAVERSGD